MRTLGRYELIRWLAMGGMGEVFLARLRGPQGFSKDVVIKTLLPAYSDQEDMVAEFLDEARLAARLSHPHIAATFDLGKEGDTYFLVMERLDGPSVADLQTAFRAEERRLPLACVVSILDAACQGLHHAHTLTDSHGTPLHIVHRDVSPKNLMITRDGILKIIDFGIASAKCQLHRTRTDLVKGTNAYMSPEQCLGNRLDARSDLFSLGVVAWEMLSGSQLFSAPTAYETMKAVAAAQVPSLRQFTPEVPPAFEAIIQRALCREPEGRFQDARSMAGAIQAFSAEQHILAGPASLAALLRDLPGAPFAAEPPTISEEPVRRPTTVQRKAEAARDQETTDRENLRTAVDHPLACPKCRFTILQNENVAGAKFARCPDCGGIYLDALELRSILRRKIGEAIDNLDAQETSEHLDAIPAFCPKCRAQMELVQGPFAVFYDRCHGCGSVFLDEGELRSLQRLPDTL